MTTSKDIRWRCVVLHYMYGIEYETIALLLGISRRTVARFNAMFKAVGHVSDGQKQAKKDDHGPWRLSIGPTSM